MKALFALLAVIIGLTSVLTVGEVTRPEPRPATVAVPDVVPVVGTTVVCPELRAEPGQLTSRVSVGAVPVGDPSRAPSGEAPSGGSLTSVPLTGTETPQAVPVTQPGQVVAGLATGLDRNALVLDAAGSLAAGLEAEQITRGESGASRGLAGLRCTSPGTDQWYVGGGTRPGETSILVLANTDAQPALVDVQVWTPTGPVDARPGRGLVVGPRSRLRVSLNDLAPGRGRLTTRVTATRGRVASGVLTTRAEGSTPKGAEWVPQALPPAERVVIAGVPQGPGSRSLLVSNPSSVPTAVSVELTTADGQFVPTGLESLPVPAGTVVAADLSSLLRDTAAAVVVRSADAPVLASVLVIDGADGGVQDVSYAGSASALAGPALLTDVALSAPVESTLLLSAVDADASVVITPLPVQGSRQALPAPRTIDIPGGSISVLRLSELFAPGARARLAVEVRPQPGSGPVHAARYLRENGNRGPLTTLLALQSAAQQVVRPPVAADPAAGRLSRQPDGR